MSYDLGGQDARSRSVELHVLGQRISLWTLRKFGIVVYLSTLIIKSGCDVDRK
jgi:hypothetical protein